MSSKQDQKGTEPELAPEQLPTPAATVSDPDVRSQSGTSSHEGGTKSTRKDSRRSDASSSNDTYFDTSCSSDTSSDDEPLKNKRRAIHTNARLSRVHKTQSPGRHRKASPGSIAALQDLVRYEKAAHARIADPSCPDDTSLEEVVQKLKQEDIAKKETAEKAHRRRMRRERKLRRQQQHHEGCKEADNDARGPVQSYIVGGPGVEARTASYRKKYKFVPHNKPVAPFRAKCVFPVDTETGLRRVKGMGLALKSCPYIYGGKDAEGKDIWLVKEKVPTSNAGGTAEQRM